MERRRLPAVMGILNVTPDSFSDGGRFAGAEDAIAAGLQMWAEGAAIIDVGGESTRPGAASVPVETELARTIPVVRGLVAGGARVSIDSMKAPVMRAALAAGATMLNDVSALQADADSLAVAAASTAEVVLMHMPGNPRTMQGLAHYADVVADVAAALRARVEVAVAAGIARDRLIVDPGIGFGKNLAQNLQLLQSLEEFHGIGVRVMLGASHKGLIGRLAGGAPPDRRLGGSLALALRGAEAGVHWLRVHDVFETCQALALWQAARA